MPDLPCNALPPLPPVPDFVTLVLAALEAAALHRLRQDAQTDGTAPPRQRPRTGAPPPRRGPTPSPPV
jgi:hypothetical protein